MSETTSQAPEIRQMSEKRESKSSEPNASRQRGAADIAARGMAGGNSEAETSARALGDVARRVVEQGQAAVQAGFGSMTNAQAPMAESSYLQGRRSVDTAARMTELYREAAERTTDDLHALTAAGVQLMRGMYQWQHTCFEMLQRSLERLGQKPQALMSCRSFDEMAQIQRDIYLDMMTNTVTSSTTLLNLTAQVAQESVRHLERTQRPG